VDDGGGGGSAVRLFENEFVQQSGHLWFRRDGGVKRLQWVKSLMLLLQVKLFG
jgi:hypothetical protein